MYIGRFAPSPTGPLHFGSLIAATASYLEAKQNQGKWLVRIEDIDPPREVPGSSTQILKTLESVGLFWDGDVFYQHSRKDAYEAVLENLKRKGLLYPCTCSRKDIASLGATGIEGAIYPGTCRDAPANPDKKTCACRIRTHSGVIHFEDVVQGPQIQRLEQDIGDFVLKRADGLISYQLAVVIDDHEQGITHVVRGSDLLASTPRQIYLQNILGFQTPVYAHIPVAVNATGEKLSKQTLASPLDAYQPLETLWQALNFLGQNPPSYLRNTSIEELWGWIQSHWNLSNVPRKPGLLSPLN